MDQSLSPEVTSLGSAEPQNVQVDEALVEFLLNNKGELVTVTFKRTQVLKLFHDSDFISSASRPEETFSKPKVVESINLRDYQLSSFNYIMHALVSKKVSHPDDNLDLVDLNKLAAYMGINDTKVGSLIYTDSKLLYPLCLSPEDNQIRKYEIALRNRLYENEDTDFRDQDHNFVFEKVCESMNFQPYRTQLPQPAAVSNQPAIPPKPRRDVNSPSVFPTPQCSRCAKYYNTYVVYGRLYCQKHGSKRNPRDPDYDIQTRDLPNVEDVKYPMIGIPKEIALYRIPFDEAFKQATLGIFDDMDWTDIIVAGGAGYTLLTGLGAQSGAGIPSDFDFNIITKDPVKGEDACQKVCYHFEKYCNENVLPRGGRTLIVRTQHAVTMSIFTDEDLNSKDFSTYRAPVFKIQVILRLYNSIAQVLSGFDIDAACIAYDGKQLYCMQRFVRVLKCGINIVDPERQSTTYAQRLRKYLDRGVAIAIPDYIDKRVVQKPDITLNPKGLARIIAYWYAVRESRERKSQDAFTEEGPQISDYGYEFLSTLRTDMRMQVARMALRAYNIRLYKGEEPQIKGYRAQLKRFGEIMMYPNRYLREIGQTIPIRVYSSVRGLMRNLPFDEEEITYRGPPVEPAQPVQQLPDHLLQVQNQAMMQMLQLQELHIQEAEEEEELEESEEEEEEEEEQKSDEEEEENEDDEESDEEEEEDPHYWSVASDEIETPEAPVNGANNAYREYCAKALLQNRIGDFDIPSSLSEKLEFKVKNTGEQRTNSFNPTDEEWYSDLYIAKSICIAETKESEE